MKKTLLSTILAAAMIVSLAGCNGKKETVGGDSVSVASNEVTLAEKKAYVDENYAELLSNDFRTELPFSDMIGLPLSKLKAAVADSDQWNEETSVWSEFTQMTGLNADVAYAFSDRSFNVSGGIGDGIKDTLIQNIIAGGINLFSSEMESAHYYYISTDDTSDQLITDVFILWTNTGHSASEITDSVASIYKGGSTDAESDYTGYPGVISDIEEKDYEEIYDYDRGISTKVPSCLGILIQYHVDDNILIQIRSIEGNL